MAIQNWMRHLAVLALALHGTAACQDQALSSVYPRIDVAPMLYDFGTIPDAETRSATFVLRNDGTGPLRIEAVALSSPLWQTDLVPLELEPGQRTFQVTCLGGQHGPHAGTLELRSNDRSRPEVTVDLLALVLAAANQVPTVRIDAPTPGLVAEPGQTVQFSGQVADPDHPAQALELVWRSDRDGELQRRGADMNGSTHFALATLSAGLHTITLTATDPAGASATASVPMSVCSWESPVDFDHDLQTDSWVIAGDAYWDSNGWLELTGLVQDAAGSIFNLAEPVDAGHVEIGFRIWSGGGTGADGFSMSVIDAAATSILGGEGGCLGYGLVGCEAPAGSTPVRAFHLEFDTWQNDWDPSSEDHVALTLDSDPTYHYLWAPMPDLEDGRWHDVVVQVDAPEVRVTIDGVELLRGSVPALTPFTGHIGFTGATGWATNYHRFDELSIAMECTTPAQP